MIRNIMTATATNTVATQIPDQPAETIGLNNNLEVDLILMKKTINHCFNIVMNVLHNSAYNLKESNLSQMSNMFANASIYITDSTEKTLTVPIFDNNNNLLHNIETTSISQIIDYIPSNINERTIAPITILIISQNCTLWTIIHELCHLLSTEPCYQIDSKHILHRCGINTFLYAIKNGRLLLKSTNGHNGINELITDYITWHLLCIIFNQQIPTIYNGIDHFHSYVKKQCTGNVSIEQFIGWYFSGETKKMDDLLTNRKTITYETLHRILHAQKQKESVIL